MNFIREYVKRFKKWIICYDVVFSFQCGNMAREGLRTLVVAKKILTEEQYQEFDVRDTGYTTFVLNITIFFTSFVFYMYRYI